MEYLYGADRDYADYACGSVLRGGVGMPNFPARLALELYGRGAAELGEQAEVTLWDPCCGSGYALSVIALLAERRPCTVLGSDISETAVRLAQENLSLLTQEGRERRRSEIARKHEEYARESYRLSLESLARIEEQAQDRRVHCEAFVHDVLSDELPAWERKPNLVVTDIPYGSLVSWQGEQADLGEQLLQRICNKLDERAVVVVCMDKHQRVCSEGYVRLQKEKIGKRRFEIYQKA